MENKLEWLRDTRLRRPLLEREYAAELEHITAGNLHRLEQYHKECVKDVRAITDLKSDFKWATLCSGVDFTARSETRSVVGLDGFSRAGGKNT